MKKLFIHLGTGKTGTTAIQSFMSLNHSALLRKGVNYCRTGLHRINHHGLCFNDHRHDPAYAERVKRKLSCLIDEIVASEARRHVISSENFPGLTLSEIEYMVGLLSPHCDINVIIYFRRQDQFLESWFAQIVKAGALDADISGLRSQLVQAKIFDYFYHAEKWGSLIGKDKVHVRPYERSQFYGGNIFSDFLNVLGLSFDPDFEQVQRDPNPSLSREQVCFARALAPYLDGPDISLLLKPVELGRSESSRYFLPPSQRRELLEQYMPINNSVAKKYLEKQSLFDSYDIPDATSWIAQGPISPSYVEDYLRHIADLGGEGFERIRKAIAKFQRPHSHGS
ncbi:hypothetical protein [Microbulbifer yueqingensis]|uniref:Sulfotransferase family protein n=1 Tax=Microbulbifer yueqingensis TaxID=658219 RepID=A0A1G9A938_9GAMM|nr:hypothetical protein [Microbulbifer yueqingensis]SDK23882.1 hypothetical protein SAMN05216212_1902 [Microbulbifer yueqingensis]